jgi:hypothetical protein
VVAGLPEAARVVLHRLPPLVMVGPVSSPAVVVVVVGRVVPPLATSKVLDRVATVVTAFVS